MASPALASAKVRFRVCNYVSIGCFWTSCLPDTIRKAIVLVNNILHVITMFLEQVFENIIQTTTLGFKLSHCKLTLPHTPKMQTSQ